MPAPGNSEGEIPMKTSWQCLVLVVFLGAGLVCLGRCQPPANSGAEPVSDALRQLFPLRQELPGDSAARRKSRAAKFRVVKRLLAGRLTLPQAATRFRDLNASAPEGDPYLRRVLPGVPPEQALCRQVIWYAEAELRTRDPQRVGEVVARLERELADLNKRPGAMRLPGGP
jgi:hypothetical protein